MSQHIPKRFAYRRPAELTAKTPGVASVVIVGAGPVGLAAAIDLALQGIPCVVLDDNDVVSQGSRAICWAKRTLEIFDRLGVAQPMLDKGVTWKVGRVYHRARELYHFDLLPEGGHKMPAFINLQQYYVEEYLAQRAGEFPDLIDLRWKNRVTGIASTAAGLELQVETPDGNYRLQCEWAIAADGARSSVRQLLGHSFEGVTFEEKFLIADVRLSADYPTDRRFWFQPLFDPGESVLIHRQPDDVFRIDFQLGWDADPVRERDPARVMERVQRVVGPHVQCEMEWCSVYTFRCARMRRFIDGRVIFAGDAAHVVSPFGARGGNGGIQDIDNLCWKLAGVIRGEAPAALLDSYERERVYAADENILNSRRTTAFMSPKGAAERQFRDAVLELAVDFPFARALINSGRLSRPCDYASLSGVAQDGSGVEGSMHPGQPCLDAPVGTGAGAAGWLLGHLGTAPVALVFAGAGAGAELARGVADCGIPGLRVVAIQSSHTHERTLLDVQGLVASRYGGAPGVTYLIRPDQHILGRWPRWQPRELGAAWRAYSGGS